ncbi:MAG: acyclic terpene utilization AtuA family protein [Paracoccaceae bacterium]|nr:acyclic terpene utilization AtuA family protein [Paracoccaceae bacterium]
MVRVLVPSGALGLNYDKAALARGVAIGPDIIAIDGGSTDSGPAYLGQGVSKYARSSTKIEWAGLMEARAQAGVPLVIGTAGTCGTDAMVDWMVDITREIAAETGARVKIATLKSSQAPRTIADAHAAGRVSPLEVAPEIDGDAIRSCTNIVALAGAEQVSAALATGADIVIAGRTTDTAIIAALPLDRGAGPGAAWHGAKIGECGALCATNPQSGVIVLDFEEDGFTVTPLADGARATPHTVSAHMLYENADPFILTEPGGHLDVTEACYEAADDRSVRVTGSRWMSAERYTVKLEGARRAGYQTVLMALLRDPRYVTEAEHWASDVTIKCRAKAEARLGLAPEAFRIELRLIGRNASFGALERSDRQPIEIGILGIVTAETPALSAEIGKLLNPYLLHHPLTVEEEQPTFAFPFSPAEIERGAVYEFALNHVLTLDDPMEAFRIEVIDV